MDTKTRQRAELTEQLTEQPIRGNVIVRNVDRELYGRFCERAESLGISPESVLEEVVERGIIEWLRMRSK